MRKGEVQSQMFLYILTLIIIGLMLFFGIKWIKDINDTSTIVDATKFKKDIETAFDSMRAQYMSSKTYEFSLPDGVNQLCFVDSNTNPQDTLPPNQGVCDSSKSYYNRYICDAWKDKVSSVIVYPALSAGIDIGSIEIDTPTKDLCFDITKNRRISVKLVGLGDMVRVKEP
jgi:hypothetical protein